MLCSRLVFLFLFSISFYACSSAREGSSQKSHQVETSTHDNIPESDVDLGEEQKPNSDLDLSAIKDIVKKYNTESAPQQDEITPKLDEATIDSIVSDVPENKEKNPTRIFFPEQRNSNFNKFWESVTSVWKTSSNVVGGAIEGARPYVESAYKDARPYVESAYKDARPYVESAYDRLSKVGCYDKSLAEEGIDIAWIIKETELTYSSNGLLDEYDYVPNNEGRKIEEEEVMSSIYLDKPSFQFDDLGYVYKKVLSGKETDIVESGYLSFYTPAEESRNIGIGQNKDYIKIEKRTNLNNELELTLYRCNQEDCEKLGKKDSYLAEDLFKAQSSTYSSLSNSFALQRYINKEDIVCRSMSRVMALSSLFKETLNKARFARITKRATIDQNTIAFSTLIPEVVFIDVAKEGEEETSIKLAIDFKTLFLESLGDALDRLDDTNTILETSTKITHALFSAIDDNKISNILDINIQRDGFNGYHFKFLPNNKAHQEGKSYLKVAKIHDENITHGVFHICNETGCKKLGTKDSYDLKDFHSASYNQIKNRIINKIIAKIREGVDDNGLSNLLSRKHVIKLADLSKLELYHYAILREHVKKLVDLSKASATTTTSNDLEGRSIKIVELPTTIVLDSLGIEINWEELILESSKKAVESLDLEMQ